MPGTLNIVGNYTTDNGPQTVQPAQVTQATPVGGVTLVTLASGTNTITVPAGSSYMVIQPPSTNTQTLTLKGVAGDTGVRISQIYPTVIYFDPAGLPATFVITAGGATTGNTSITFV